MAAKIKIDQETLKKHRFWFLLPVVGLALLIAWILVLYVRADAAANFGTAKTTDTQLRSLRSNPDKRNEQWIAASRVKKLESLEQKNQLWIKEYDAQNGVVREPAAPPAAGATATDPLETLPPIKEIRNPLITWPEATATTWDRENPGRQLRRLDFGEWLRIVPVEYRDHYEGQFDRCLDPIPWYNEATGTGAVRVKGGSGNHRAAAMELLSKANLRGNPTVLSEEAWVLQEDLAIRRELIKILGEVVDRFATLQPEWQAIAITDNDPAPKAASPALAANGAHAAAPTATSTAPAKPGTVIRIDRKAFYNYTWTSQLIPPSDATRPASNARQSVDLTLEPWRGWLLDLELVEANGKVLLRGQSTNHSPRLAVPKQRLAVYFNEVGSGAEMATPLILEDAGELPPAEFGGDGKITNNATKKLREQPVPTGAFRISRVTRANEGDILDAFHGFNQHWILELELRGSTQNTRRTLTGFITNRSDRRQRVPGFLMTLSDGNTDQLPERLRVPVDEINSGARRAFTIDLANRPVMLKLIRSVKQELDWRTVPLKRIDRMELGVPAQEQSDRLRVLPLVPYDFAKKDPRYLWGSETPKPAPENPPKPRETSENHEIRLTRYLEVTNEVRRLPVALVLVVDANYVNDVLTAMSNSRLRFQVTQAVWNRIPALGRPPGPSTTASRPGDVAPGTMGGSSAPPAGAAARGSGQTPQGGGMGGAGAAEGFSNVAPQSGGGIGLGGGGSTGGGGAGMAASRPPAGTGMAGSGRSDAPQPKFGFVDDSHVVQLQIYGLITLYESPDAFKRLRELRNKR